MGGSRRELVVYVLAGVTYIAAGIAWKGLLNWIIGPVWLVTFVWADHEWQRRRRRVTP